MTRMRTKQFTSERMTELWAAANAAPSDAAQVALAKQCRVMGWSDRQIMEAASKPMWWLRDTDAINTLDEKCWTAFHNGEIGRAVALRLSEIKDVEHRVRVFKLAGEMAAKRLAALHKRIDEEVPDEPAYYFGHWP